MFDLKTIVKIRYCLFTWGLIVFCTPFGYTQNDAYRICIRNAEEYFSKKEYGVAAAEYSKAFKILGWKGIASDRFNAAKAWALSGNLDSAFFQLNRLLSKTDYLNYHDLIIEKGFSALHSDKRWKDILQTLNPDQEVYIDTLARILEEIGRLDQKYRKQDGGFEIHIREAKIQDSLNLIQVRSIIDKYGWLSANQVGTTGNTTLWLVLQHAPLNVMEMYLPVLEQAVENVKASKKHLAYFKDRILMYQGKPQLYGTQYKILKGTSEAVLWEVQDPENLNKRRESMGMPPMNAQKN